MGAVPQPRSFNQILGDQIAAFTSRSGIQRLKVGDPFLSMLEAASRSDVRQSQDVFQVLTATDLDNAEDTTLDHIGNSEGSPRRLLAKTTGDVDISDTSVIKKSSAIYHGASAPIIGSVVINVDDTTTWPGAGSVYIGRRTANVEGPLSYTSITNNGSYKTLNLSTPTTRFHNLGEEVVLAQGGNRIVDAGTLVATAQGALTAATQFSTVFDVTIPDGEVVVTEVDVVATTAGASSNVPAQSVKEFPGGVPFSGAAVINPKPFVTGRDTETNNAYRDRIRRIRNSKQRGTDLALTEAVIGAISPDENKRVTSAVVVRRPGAPSKLFIDDGSGYEETSAGVGIEVVVDSASGGEDGFETLQRPVVKAFLASRNTAPFVLTDAGALSVSVGGVTTTHIFDAALFNSISAASAYEVTASINGNPALLWGARTADSGTIVVLFARAETNEDLVVVAAPAADFDMASAFLFPASRRFTSLLYKNDRLLTKDGSSAAIRSLPFAGWNSFSGSQTLIVAVDQTPAATYTFVNQNFVDALTGFTAVGKNSLAAWAAVMNRAIPGITATVEGDVLVLTSNLGHNRSAAVTISGGTLISNFAFTTTSSLGTSFDYNLDRGTGQFVTVVPLAVGDRLTLGSAWTRAFLESPALAPFGLASDVDTWWAVDAGATIIPHGVGPTTPLTATVMSVTEDAHRIKITATSTSEVFADVEAGDWAILWDPDTDLPTSLRKAWRVVSVEEVTSLDNAIVLEKEAAANPRAAAGATALVPQGAALSLVLVTGGYSYVNAVASTWTYHGKAVTAECETFDPNTGAWTGISAMAGARAHHTATLLANGKVFVAGGYGHDGESLNTTEIWDPGTGLWAAGPTMAVPRAEHSATLLNNGRVLVAGGVNTGTATATSEEYDLGSNTFINPQVMATARYGHGAVLLPTGAGPAGAEAGNVLVVGGISGAFPLAFVERYNSAVPGWSNKTGMGAGFERAHFGLAVAATQKVLAVGDSEFTGGFSSDNRSNYQVYSVDTDSWTAAVNVETNYRFTDKRYGLVKSATNSAVIAYGGVLIAGGFKTMRHKRFDGIALTWSTIAGSPFSLTAVERNVVSGVALSGGVSPDRAWFYGGVSAGNTAANNTSGRVAATAEIWNDDTSLWEIGENATALLNGTLGNRGLTFVRTTNALHHGVIPAGIDYTAPTLGAAINAVIEGITASVYRTTKLRVQTNSYSIGDDILLAATTDPTLPLTPEVVETNTVGHFGSVVAANTGLGTPADFLVQVLAGTAAAPHATGMQETVYLAPTDLVPPYAATLLGLRRLRDGLNPRFWESFWTPSSDPDYKEYGNTKDVDVVIGALDLQGTALDRTRIGLRRVGVASWAPAATAVLALPYAMSPRDTLTVIVDEDTETKRFSLPLWRRLKPSATTYSTQIAVKDFDASNNFLAQTFGIDYDFNDFALYMQARARSHGADATKRILWRFFRHGPEGNAVVVRYTYPTTPNSVATVVIDSDQRSDTNDLGTSLKVFANIVLGSGAARTGNNLTTSTRIGLARVNGSSSTAWDVYTLCGYNVIEAQRTVIGGTTRLRIQMPNNGVVANAPSASGISPGTILWFQATSPGPSTIFSGSFAVDSVGAFNVGTGQQDIFVPAGVLNDNTSTMPLTPNPGFLSFDASGPVNFDPAIAAGDLVYLTPPDLIPSYTGTTMRVLASGPTYIISRSLDLNQDGADSGIGIHPLLNPSDFVVFRAPTQTATQIAGIVNGLTGPAGISPVGATVIGSGSGVIALATWDELNNHIGGYFLADGLNYVQRTVIPGNNVTDTEFVLRAPITADLQTNSDWINEDIRLVPVLAEDVVSWLNTPAVTGLESVAETVLAENGRTVQIASLTAGSSGAVEIQGGTSDLATAAVFGSAELLVRNGSEPTTASVVVRRAEADGFIGDRWVVGDNTNGLPKAAFWSSGTTAAVAVTGVWTFGTAPYTVLSNIDEVHIEVERVGRFVAVHLPLSGNAAVPTLTQCPEFGYLYLTTPTLNRSDLPAIGTANTGIFRIIRTSSNGTALTLWIESSIAIDGASVCRLKTLSADSVVPGDTWTVSTAWLGTGNQGAWSVVEVGSSSPGGQQFVSSNFTVDITAKIPETRASAAIGTAAPFLQVIGVPARVFKKILTVTPHQADPTFVDVQFYSSPGYSVISAAGGTILTASDKLAFPAGIFTGVDGYSYGTGLLHEANKIVYGDPADEDTYPGYASNGASVLIQGPTVKRIKLTLSLRVQSGLASDDLADRVRSAVASVINQGSTGISIPISNLTDAAGEVGGVIAVAVVAPTYTSTSDLIPVGAGEKPLVLDLRADIKIAFVGA